MKCEYCGKEAKQTDGVPVCDPYCDESGPRFVTVYDLCLYRLGLDPLSVESLSGEDFEKAGLPIMGGCEVCHATVSAGNSCPSKSGYIRCASGCIDDLGYMTVQDANREIFGEDAEIGKRIGDS